MKSSWFPLETELRFCNSKAWLEVEVEVEVEVDGSIGVLKLYSRLHLSQIFHNTIIHRLCVLYQQQREQVRMPPQSCMWSQVTFLFVIVLYLFRFFKCNDSFVCLVDQESPCRA